MASFARSFKPPPALLPPRRRPGMASRTLSNSSELSLTPNTVTAHQTDYFVDRPVTSAPNTPLSPTTVGPVLEEGSQSTAGSPEVAANSARASNSDPIAIQLPKLRKLSSGPACTPPEPLSARGDLPGGYFPLHEDPKGRVQRPHPFASESAHLRHSRASDSITMQAERARHPHVAMPASLTHSSTPVSSYIASGFHDAPQPLGKYYPSNYEHQHPQHDANHSRLAPVADLATSSAKSDSHVPQSRPESSRIENPQMEMRRKMRQYQRDMIAQATMVLGASTRTASPGVYLNGLSIEDIGLSKSTSLKPLSPRLHPLGSPGPVTPMELEASASSYVDLGMKSPPPPSRIGHAPPGVGVDANSA